MRREYEVVIPFAVRANSPEEAAIEAEIALRNHAQSGIGLVAKVIEHNGAVTEGFDGTWHKVMEGDSDASTSA